MTARHDHWIDGRNTPPWDGRYLSTTNPATNAPGHEVAAGTASDADRAVSAAAAAQHGWARRSGAERSEALHAIADALSDNHEGLTELEREATGKLDTQLRLELDMSISYFRYYAGVLRSVSGRTIDIGPDTHAFTRLEPYGVVAAITPWNLPLNQACRAIAPALAVGNTVVAKPSEFTSTTTLRLAALASAAGLPDGVLNVVTGTGADVGAPLVADRRVRRITFTGSVATGRWIAGVAADRLAPATLELGGKSPSVVFADADLDAAVDAAVSAMTFNAGQVCSATTRLLLEAPVHDEISDRVVRAAERLRPGIDIGPMITTAQYEKVLDHFDAARTAGLVPAVGGAAFPGTGRYIRPTVYVNVPPSADIARTEIFGPVLVTMPFSDEDDAVALANDSDYGLVAALWTGDVGRGIRMAKRIEAGQVSVNGGPLTIETPFGGFKTSGYGREKGIEALHDYAQVKSVSVRLR